MGGCPAKSGGLLQWQNATGSTPHRRLLRWDAVWALVKSKTGKSQVFRGVDLGLHLFGLCLDFLELHRGHLLISLLAYYLVCLVSAVSLSLIHI